MRALPMDVIPGPVALVVMPLSAADTFTTEQIADAVVSPDVVIDEDLFSNQGNLQIEEVLAWDVSRFQIQQTTSPLIAASEGKTQQWASGIVRDNAVTAVPPTSDASAQHTRPGAAESGPNSRYIESWGARLSAEENAAGEIVSENLEWTHQETIYNRIQFKTNMDVSELVLSDAHYHFWGDSTVLTANIASWSLGMRARRISMDFLELMFDRQTLLGILNAVGQVF